ncbi:hypothetical protein RAB80_016435 [Fusarium oxysporum f. sp. vasinfectum]|nr:hypothetical protein RAB80_016435 [Fusarium oxysporum f. sp. vasinfectum]
MNDEAFDGTRALDLLQRRVVLDYGSKKTGSKPASEDDDYYPVFRLDFVSIVGLPRRPICRSSHFFDNITISFRHWSAPPAYLDGLDDEFDESDGGYDGESNSVPATQQGWGEIGGEEREDKLDELCDQPTVEVEDNDSLFVSERVDDVTSPIPPTLSPGQIIDAEYRDINSEVDANGPNGDKEREQRFLKWINESENTDIG